MRIEGRGSTGTISRSSGSRVSEFSRPVSYPISSGSNVDSGIRYVRTGAPISKTFSSVRSPSAFERINTSPAPKISGIRIKMDSYVRKDAAKGISNFFSNSSISKTIENPKNTRTAFMPEGRTYSHRRRPARSYHEPQKLGITESPVKERKLINVRQEIKNLDVSGTDVRDVKRLSIVNRLVLPEAPTLRDVRPITVEQSKNRVDGAFKTLLQKEEKREPGRTLLRKRVEENEEEDTRLQYLNTHTQADVSQAMEHKTLLARLLVQVKEKTATLIKINTKTEDKHSNKVENISLLRAEVEKFTAQSEKKEGQKNKAIQKEGMKKVEFAVDDDTNQNRIGLIGKIKDVLEKIKVGLPVSGKEIIERFPKTTNPGLISQIIRGVRREDGSLRALLASISKLKEIRSLRAIRSLVRSTTAVKLSTPQDERATDSEVELVLPRYRFRSEQMTS